MSFQLTTDQIRQRSKTVTRRIGWASLNAGDVLDAVVKAQGLRKGEHVEKLARIRIVSNQPEPLELITSGDVAREGFPEMTPAAFVSMFCQAMKCEPRQIVNRIEFEYVDPPP